MKILHKIKKRRFGVERADSSLEAKPKEPSLLKEPNFPSPGPTPT